MLTPLFQNFKHSISGITLPEKFTFPFFYEPHPLSIIASKELQAYLETQSDFSHNFGLDSTQEGLAIGKMFGVLVVQDESGTLGYLWAYSGKLAESNRLPYFVPTVYDMLAHDGYFKKEERTINELNRAIEAIEQDTQYLTSIENLQNTTQQAEKELAEQKQNIKTGKKIRATQRLLATTELELEALNKASQEEGILLKKMTQYWQYKTEEATKNLAAFTDKITQLKEIRKEKSASLQQKLFEEYAFLNQYGSLKSLGSIFQGNPPAGAGECAAPKLLHYAFQHQLKPIAMAEFWWGQSPKSEVRKHQHYYPACTGKCQPILAHMLEGIPLEDNPFTVNLAESKALEIVYEDDFVVVVNKPTELLSVPGKQVSDSVYTRIKSLYPEASGPLVVHRLDMATSGLLLIAKSSSVHKKLQSQFIKRQIKKQYIALLDGLIREDFGRIELPLRPDYSNLPNQLVCFPYGKSAQTDWEVVKRFDNRTLIRFYPITGRTHQLRVHAAHASGLNTPIVGDDLYGTKSNRLHLHAESITFKHPMTKESMTFAVSAAF
jgi:tRNA pseudouridine32 synthase/23S rRNA pseudouridine746 synthase